MRVARDSAERDRFWKARKAAFPAMGRISPNYFVQDGVIPRTKLPEVLERIEALGREYGLIVANVFHAGDGNLHPLVCFDSAIEGQAQAAEELSGKILEACLEVGRLDHRRAWRRRGQEEAHAQDVQRVRPRLLSAPALLI